MERRTVLSASALALAGVATLGACAAPAPTATAPVSLKQRLVGTWTLAGAYNILPNGKRFEPQGPNGKGMLMLDANGQFIWLLVRPDIRKVASNNRLTGTAAENKAVAQGVLSYYGTYSVDEPSSTMTMRIAYSSFANFNGTEQKRSISLENGQLSVVNNAGASGGVATVIWKRAE